MIAIWVLAIAVLLLAAAIVAVAWIHYGQSRLDVLTEAEIAQYATFGQGVMGAPRNAPLNGTTYDPVE